MDREDPPDYSAVLARRAGSRSLRVLRAARPAIETIPIAGPHLLLQCAPRRCLAVLLKAGLLDGPPPAPYG